MGSKLRNILLAAVLVIMISSAKMQGMPSDAEVVHTENKPKEQGALSSFLELFGGYGRSITKAKRRLENFGMQTIRGMINLPSMKPHGPSNIAREEADLENARNAYNQKQKNVFDQPMPGHAGTPPPFNPPPHMNMNKRNLQSAGGIDQEDPDGGDTTNGAQAEQLSILTAMLQYNGGAPLVFPMDYKANPCENGGQPSWINLTAYVCNFNALPKEKYDSFQNRTLCKVVTANVGGCHCPSDYYGRSCSKFLGFTCRHNSFTGYDAACLAEYNKFGKNRIGYPPCRPFRDDGTYDFEISLNCSYQNVSRAYGNTKLAQEGLKLEYLMADSNNLYYDQPKNNTPFTYVLKKEGAYNLTDDFDLNMGISYLNWGDLFEEYGTPQTYKVSNFVKDPVTKEGSQL